MLAEDDEPTDSLLAPAPPGAVTARGVVVVRLGAPLFFANASSFSDAAKVAVERAATPVRHLVLDREAITDLDVPGAESLRGV